MTTDDEEYLDERFPKGDKRRGEAMTLFALTKTLTRQKSTDELEHLVNLVYAKVMMEWKGQNEFCDWLKQKLKELSK